MHTHPSISGGSGPHTVASHSDTTATGIELETLTNGSSADYLHTHTQTAHTVASHSDTIVSGANINILAAGPTSNADALHTHVLTNNINYLDIRPTDMRIDYVNLGCDKGTAFEIISTVEFNNVLDGSIWFSFKFPDSWDITKDIIFDIQYNCDGIDNGKNIYFNTQTWVINAGDTPNISSPNNNNYDNIVTALTNSNVLADLTLPTGKIPASNLTINTNTIVVKLTRESTHITDTYGGTFQIVAVQIRQL